MTKIKSIKKTGIDKYKIELDDGSSLKIYDNIILKNNILFKKEIDESLIPFLIEENKKEDSYYQVLKFISKKIRCRKEIDDFLLKNDISLDEKNNIIKRLENNHLINDEMYARAYVQDRMMLSSDGPNKIKDDLFRNNISNNFIEKLLSEIDNDEIYKKVEKLINKKIKNNTNKSIYALKQKILFDMKNLGYEEFMINEILNNVNLTKDNSIVNKEYQKLYRKLSNKYDGNELNLQIIYKLRSKGFSLDEINSIKDN